MSATIPFQSVDPVESSGLLLQNGFSIFKTKLFFKKFFKEEIIINEKVKGFSKKLYHFLADKFSFPTLEMIYSNRDHSGNVKIGYKTHDGHIIETVVLIRDKESSVCVSTQVGCRNRCLFCATGQLSYVRNLEAWEIVEQVRLAYTNFLKEGQGLTHITVMGMGEPFENFDNVYKAFQIFIHPFTYSIGVKKVTIASVGYLPGLEKLINKKVIPNFVLSLHAPSQEIREKIIPSAKKFTMEELLDFIKRFPLKKNKRISVQYLLLKDINDQPEHAEQLGTLLKDLPVKINFMSYNIVEGLPVCAADEESREYFIRRLREFGFSSIRRQSMGKSIKAACGQLGFGLKNNSL